MTETQILQYFSKKGCTTEHPGSGNLGPIVLRKIYHIDAAPWYKPKQPDRIAVAEYSFKLHQLTLLALGCNDVCQTLNAENLTESDLDRLLDHHEQNLQGYWATMLRGILGPSAVPAV